MDIPLVAIATTVARTTTVTKEEACKLPYDYVEEVDEDSLCSICTNVFQEPTMCKACEKFFCTACIDEWKKTKHDTCPLCRSKEGMGVTLQAGAMKVKINKLSVRCPFDGNGCTWTGERMHRNNHVQECVRVKPGCQYGCDTTLRGPALLQHETTCIYRSLQPLLRRLETFEQNETVAKRRMAALLQRVQDLERHVQQGSTKHLDVDSSWDRIREYQMPRTCSFL